MFTTRFECQREESGREGKDENSKEQNDNREVSVPVRVRRDRVHGRAGGTGLAEEE